MSGNADDESRQALAERIAADGMVKRFPDSKLVRSISAVVVVISIFFEKVSDWTPKVFHLAEMLIVVLFFGVAFKATGLPLIGLAYLALMFLLYVHILYSFAVEYGRILGRLKRVVSILIFVAAIGPVGLAVNAETTEIYGTLEKLMDWQVNPAKG